MKDPGWPAERIGRPISWDDDGGPWVQGEHPRPPLPRAEVRSEGAVKVGTSSLGTDRTLLSILHSVITRQQEGNQLVR